MIGEEATEAEVGELVTGYAERFPHLSARRHFKLVRAGYGNWMGKEGFRRWYEETVPLLTPDMVATREQISEILRYDSHSVPELGVKPLSEILSDSEQVLN